MIFILKGTTYLQIGCDPTDSPYQLTNRSHAGLGSNS